MKKITFSIFFISLFSLSHSQSVSVEYAKQAAAKFLQGQSKFNTFSAGMMLGEPQVQVNSSDTLLYIFESLDNEGFIVMSADFRAEPVLCYSPTGFLNGSNGLLPPAFKDLMQAYTHYVEDVKSAPLNRNTKKNPLWTESGNSFTTSAMVIKVPLLTTTWDQNQYYNDLCPVGGYMYGYNGRVPTGCVATAMAQIMKYWNYPNYGVGSNSYWSALYGTLSADFTEGYNWGNMPVPRPTNGNTDIPKLIYHCGISVNMNYGTDASSASMLKASDALKNYFKYVQPVNLYKSSMSDEIWINILKGELDADRPVFYRGTRTSSEEGHAFVCDGYDSDNKFHFNFGWGGSADGYYYFQAIDYYLDQSILVGIYPQAVITTLKERTITGNQVVLHGTVNPDGATLSSIQFEIKADGETPRYINASTTSTSSKIFVDVSASATLNYGKEYQYRLIAKDVNNTPVYGDYFPVSITEDVWVKQNSGIASDLNAVCMLSETTGYICGYGGVILKTTNGGANWDKQISGVTDDLVKIHFLDALTGFVLTNNGKILKTTNEGSNWSVIYNNSSTLGSTYQIYVESTSKIWIASKNGLFLYDGNNTIISKRGGTVYDVCRVNNASTSYLVLGTYENGIVYTEDETNFYGISGVALSPFQHIAAYPNSDYIIASGNIGLRKVDFSGITPNSTILTNPTTYSMLGITFSSPNTAYAIGYRENIIKTDDKGDTWKIVSSSTDGSSNLNDVSFPSSKGWAVGNRGVILYCSAAFLTIEQLEATVGAAAGNSVSLDVETNLSSYTATTTAAWLTITPELSTGKLIITANESNPNAESRQATVTVSGAGVSSITLTITQLGSNNLGIYTTNAAGNYAIYPNPVQEKLFIKTGTSIENAMIYIYDAIGRKVYQKKLSLHSEEQQCVDVSDFNSGIYNVTIEDLNNNNSSTYKIVVNK